MTRREYLQSLKDQGKTKEEAIELTRQWEIDNKPTEVEKPQATATNAATVVASPTDSTESSSEDTSLDSQNINTSKPKIEELDKIKEKEPLKKYVVPKKSIADKGTKIDIIETIPVGDDFNVNFQTDRITRKNLEELNKDVSKDNYDYSSLVSELKNSFEKGRHTRDQREVNEAWRKSGKDNESRKIDLNLIPKSTLRSYQTEENFKGNKNLIELQKLDKDLIGEKIKNVAIAQGGEKIKGSSQGDIGDYYLPIYNINGQRVEGRPVAIKQEDIDSYINKEYDSVPTGEEVSSTKLLPELEVKAEENLINLNILTPEESAQKLIEHNDKVKQLNQEIEETEDKDLIKKLKSDLTELNSNYEEETNKNRTAIANSETWNNSVYNLGKSDEKAPVLEFGPVLDAERIENKDGDLYITPLKDRIKSKIYRDESIFDRTSYKVRKDKDGKLTYEPFGKNTEVTARELAKKDPKEFTTSLNDKYLDYGLGAIKDGKNVGIYKNPVFKEDGQLDFAETLKANNIDPFGKTRFYEFNKAMVENGAGAKLRVGLGEFNLGRRIAGEDPEDAAKFMTFVNNNTTDYKQSDYIPEFYSKQEDILDNNIKKSDKIAKEYQNTVLEDNKELKKTKIKLNSKIGEINSIGKKVKNEYESTNSKVEQINSDFVKKVEDKRAELKYDIKRNPKNAEKIYEKYQKWEDKQESKRSSEVTGIVSNYEDFYKDSKLEREEAKARAEELDVLGDQLKLNIQKTLNNYDLNDAATSVLRLNNIEKYANAKDKKLNRGSVAKELQTTFMKQIAEQMSGNAIAWQTVAEAINEVGHKVGTISDREYRSYKRTFKSGTKQFLSDRDAMVDLVVSNQNTDEFSAKFSESVIGGTVNTFVQMAASVLGSPLGSMGASYFFSAVSQAEESNIQRERDYIKDAVKGGLSKEDAQIEYDELYPRSRQLMYSYTQAAVEGALSHLSGKILSGKIPGKESDDLINNITNHILREVSNGNVTAKDIRIQVNRYLGEKAAVAAKLGKTGISGILETIEETTQFYGAIEIDKWMQGKTGNQVDFQIPDMDSEQYKKDFAHMQKISFLAGLTGGSFEMAMTPKSTLEIDYDGSDYAAFQKRNDALASFADAARNESVLANELEKIENDQTLSDSEKASKRQEAEKTFSLWSSIDPDINGTSQFEVAALLEEKEKFEEKYKNITNNSRVKKKLSEFDKEIERITNDSNNVKVDKTKSIKSLEESLKIVTLSKLEKTNKENEVRIREENQNLTEVEVNKLVEESKIVLDPKKSKVIIFDKENVQEIADEYDIDIDVLVDKDGNFKNEGSILPDQQVVLIEKEASKGVIEHEDNHLYTEMAFADVKNKNVVFSLAEEVLDQMKKDNPEVAAQLELQLDKYREDANYDGNAVMQEVMPYYVQLRERGFFDKENSVSRQLKRGMRNLYQSLGFKLNVRKDNILEIISDYADNQKEGITTKSQKRLLQGEVNIDNKLREEGNVLAKEDAKKETPIIPINKESDSQTKLVASKPIKIDTQTMSNSFDSNLNEDIVTNEDFKNSDAVVDAFSNINDNEQFNNYVNQLINRDNNLQSLPSEVKQDINRKIKENLSDRVIKNFKPVLDGNKRSLFSYIYGKADQRGLGGIAQKSLLDIKKEYATSVDSDARSIDKPTSEGQAFDIEDKSAEQDIINRIDSGEASAAPKSQFRRNIKRDREKGLTPKEVKEFEEISQPLVDKLPDVNAKNYRTQVNKVAGPALKKWVNDNIFNNNWGEQFIIDNYNNIRDLGIDYLIDLDKGLQKQGKPRMFTKFNRKLTTQAEIRKYRDSGRAFVENEAQGVSLYDILDPGDQAMADFYLKDSPSNRSNRKGKLAEAFGKKMFKDVQPQIRNKRGDSDQVKATSARKTQVVPTLLFAKKLDKSLIEASQWLDKNEIADKVGFNEESLNESTRDAYQAQMEDAAEKGFLDLDVVLAGQMGSGGKQTFYGDKNNRFNGYKQAEKAGIKNIGKYIKTKDGNFYKLADVKLEDGVLKTFNLDKYRDQILNVDPSLWVAKPGNLYYGAKDPAYIKLLETVGESNFSKGFTKVKIDKKGKFIGRRALKEKLNKKVKGTDKTQEQINMDMLDHVVNKLAKSVSDGMSMDIAGMIIVQSYQNTSGLIKASARFAGISNVFESGKKLEIRSKKLYREEHNPPASVVGASILVAIKQNQAKAVMKDLRKNFTQTILSKKDDSKLDATYPSTMPKGSSIASDPIVRMAMAGINLNTIEDIQTGETYADKFGLGVANTIQTFPGIISLQNKLIEEVVIGKEVDGKFVKKSLSDARKQLDVYAKFPTNGQPSLAKTQNDSAIGNRVELKESKVLDIDGDMNMETLLSKAAGIDEALKLSNSLDQPVKKIRVFDFDDTLAKSNNKVFATKGDQTIEMNAEKFASDASDMIKDGWVMDFSDFNNVTDGKRGPLFEIAKTIRDSKGNEDLFVLTARGPESQQAIYDFLKAEGLEFKKENIVGLGKSPGEAKANWMIDKAAEGYNDFYFADDAYQNVKAVRDVMSVIDVKSKVQQARIKESKNLSEEFNSLLQETTGVDTFKEYSAAKAKTIGASKGNFKFFIPYSAEDFLGLVYPTLSKGSKGDAQMAWYKTNLIDKYTKAQENLSTARLNLMNDFKQLKKSLNVPSNLRKKNDNGFTNEQAVRVHLFTSMGYEVPGLSKRDLKQLNDTVENDATLKEFSEQILQITKGDGYANPDANWLVGNITTDLISLINTEKRSKYLANWQESVDAIYSKENLNKLEALYGTKYVDALTNMLTRMKTGKNRLTSGSKIENQILDYVNGSIGTIMFFNTRSAVLQTISSINFVNWSFNNPYQAGKAFANQKQYWSDFKELMNSDYLLDRRNGLKLNISESEIADAAATSKNKAKAAINYILSKGFLPTQYADSFAIASGGATFYRNRIKDLVRQGKTETEAKKQALIEFRQVAEESQQSSDPSRISQQQSSNVGRLILAFANTPMQYARIQKRAIQDLVNGRGDAKSHVSRIVYYGFVQNVIFNALQQAVFALGFGDDDDEKEEAKNKKYLNVANGMLDSLLRGLGIGGAAVSVAKNFLMDIYERSGRDRPEYVDSVWEVTRFSPPIYSKLSKLKQAAWQFDSKKRRELIFEKGFSLDNPAYEAAAKVVSATTNVPLDRVMYKIKNIEGALDEDNEIWQRVAMMGGWPKWQLESPKTAADLSPEQKAEVKAKSKIDNYKKAKGSKDYETIKKLTSDQQIKMLKGLGFGEYTIKNAKTEKAKIDLIIAKNSKKKNIVDKKAIEEYKYKKLNKAEQVRKLDSLGLSKDEIKALKLEADRVEKLVELMK